MIHLYMDGRFMFHLRSMRKARAWINDTYYHYQQQMVIKGGRDEEGHHFFLVVIIDHSSKVQVEIRVVSHARRNLG